MEQEKDMRQFHRTKQQGFTLIELLIVIAIILILIAIALPNFLEAQIRARVVRCQGDMRTIGIALDTYYLDFNMYPDDHEPDGLYSNHGLFQLTSPLQYLTELPIDPFTDPSSGLVSQGSETGWELASTGEDPLRAMLIPPTVHAYALDSSGPDFGENLGGGSGGADDFYGNGNWPFLGRSLTCPSQQGWVNYSPTNGTKSLGDIVLVGGEHRSGRYCIDFWELVSGTYPKNAPN